MKIKRALLFLVLGVLLTAAVPVRAGYRVENGRIYNDANQQIQLRGVNWFGFETPDHVAHGLWARNWRSMITQMRTLGFNAVRLPFCPPTIQSSSVSTVNYSLNSDLQNKNSLEVFDLVVNEFNAQGFYILLDHHRPDCSAISELWYTGSYTEQQWINDLVFVANRYKSLPGFIGVDLKNEPHGAATWGSGNLSTDWNKAAERAAAVVLQNAPNILIFVEGVANTSTCSDNTYGHFWGENLQPLACAPLAIPANRLVLAPHVYGPDVFGMPYFDAANFPANMPAIWEQHFGRFSPNYAMVIGEFGGKYGRGNPRDRVWQNAFVDYLISKNIHSGFYWSWNANSGDTGGILQDDWTNHWQDKVDLLNRLWALPPVSGPVSVGGRVTRSDGRAFSGTRVVLTAPNGAPRFAQTNPNGFYRFANVNVGQTITISAQGKYYRFTPQTFTVNDARSDVNFTALP